MSARIEFAVDYARDEVVLCIDCDELPRFTHRIRTMALDHDATGEIGKGLVAFVETYRDGTAKGEERHERLTPLVIKTLEAYLSDMRSPLRAMLRSRWSRLAA